MENGDEVSKRGCLCPKNLGGGNYPQDILGGRINYPNDPPYIRHLIHLRSLK